MPPFSTMLYQSTETLNPGSHLGFDSTTPRLVFLAIAGVRSGLPITFWRTSSAPPEGAPGGGVPVDGIVKLGIVVVTGAANSSDRLGARTSREVTARRRTPSSGVSQVPPPFQV